MSRVNPDDRYFVAVKYGQGFTALLDSTNNREFAFRNVSIRAAGAHRKHTKNVVPTFLVLERVAMQKVEAKPSKSKVSKPRIKKDA